eukprot:56590_1
MPSLQQAKVLMKLFQIIGVIVSLSGIVSVIMKFVYQENANEYSDACCGYINDHHPNCSSNQYETYGFTKDVNNICLVNNMTCNAFPPNQFGGEYYNGYYYISKGGNFSYCTVNQTDINNDVTSEVIHYNLDETALLNTTCTEQNIHDSINWANDQVINFLLWFVAAFPGFFFSFALSVIEVFSEKLNKMIKVCLCILCCPCILCCRCEGECKGSGLIINIGYYFAKFILYAFAKAGNDQFNSGVNDSLYFAIDDWSEESYNIFANCYGGYKPLVYDNTTIQHRFSIIDQIVTMCVYIGYGLTVAQFLLNQYIDKLKPNEGEDGESFLVN